MSLTDASSRADALPRSRPSLIPRRLDVELFEVAPRSTARVHGKLRRHRRRLSEVAPAAFLMDPSGSQWREVMDRLTEVKRKQGLVLAGGAKLQDGL